MSAGGEKTGSLDDAVNGSHFEEQFQAQKIAGIANTGHLFDLFEKQRG